MYNEHKNIFEKVVRAGLENKAGIEKTICDVFKGSPSQKNLTEFFKNDIIKALWFGHNEYNKNTPFNQSIKLKELLDSFEILPGDIRTKVYSFFKKVKIFDNDSR